MEYRRLGKTDMFVSVISLGGWALATDKNFGEQDEEESVAVVHAALDAGVNFFDTAEGYGKDGASERVLGRALAGRRKDAIITTRVEVDLRYVSAPETLKQCEASLWRLGTDYIDVYEIHWPSRLTPFAETMEAMQTLKQQGKIRAIGVSNFGVQDLTEILALGRVEVNQLPYNLLFRAIEYGIAQKCLESHISITPYSPIAQGLLTGKYASADDVPLARARTRHYSNSRALTRHGEEGAEEETFAAVRRIGQICAHARQPMVRVALAWLLHQQGVASVVVGARDTDQLAQNVAAASLELSPQVLAELDAATAELKQKLGPNPDPWQSSARTR
jgi:myo-inositol catabolism protein IolS